MMWIFIACGILVIVEVAAWAAFVEPYRYRLTKRTIQITATSIGLQGLTILHISDLHFRKHDARKIKFIQSLAQVPVDFVFITGDLTEEEGAHHTCIEALRHLKGRYGTYAVLGSHDYAQHLFWDVVRHFLIPGNRSWTKRISPEPLVKGLMEAGIYVLRNENVCVNVNGLPVRIIGLEDPYLNMHDIARATQGVSPGEFTIMLVHTPEKLEQVQALGINLVLAGHTHGGQVRFPFIGAVMTRCDLPARHAAGAFSWGQTVFHINNGIGTGSYTGIRFLCPPEATVLSVVGDKRSGSKNEDAT